MTPDRADIGPATAVLVSGGSRGLGLAVVTALLDRGVKVATFARRPTAELTALAGVHGDTLHNASLDARDHGAVDAFLGEAAERFGRLDGLVNNAAMGQDTQLAHTPADRVAAIVSTNLTAPLLLTRAFLRQVLPHGGTGRVVMVSSICAQRGYAGVSVYSAAKGGLDAATRALARELRGRVLVNTVAPGFFASELSSSLNERQLATIVRRTPSGRLADTADIVPMVLMLLLDNVNINGTTLTVDGGVVA